MNVLKILARGWVNQKRSPRRDCFRTKSSFAFSRFAPSTPHSLNEAGSGGCSGGGWRLFYLDHRFSRLDVVWFSNTSLHRSKRSCESAKERINEMAFSADSRRASSSSQRSCRCRESSSSRRSYFPYEATLSHAVNSRCSNARLFERASTRPRALDRWERLVMRAPVRRRETPRVQAARS